MTRTQLLAEPSSWRHCVSNSLLHYSMTTRSLIVLSIPYMQRVFCKTSVRPSSSEYGNDIHCTDTRKVPPCMQHGHALCTPVIYLPAQWVNDHLSISTMQSMLWYSTPTLHWSWAHLSKWQHTCLGFQSVLHSIQTGASLIASIPRSISNPSNHLSITRTSTITGRVCSSPSLILACWRHFRDLPSAVSTPTFCLHWRHTTLLTSVYEHPESARAMHSRLSTTTFTTSNCWFFTCSGRRLALMPSLLWCFPGNLIKCAQFYCIENTVVRSWMSMLCLTSPAIQFFAIWLDLEHL